MRQKPRYPLTKAFVLFGALLMVFSASAEARHIIREGQPTIAFKKLYAPATVKQGEIFKLSAEITISKNVWEDDSVFLHICRTPDNTIVINNNFSPANPSTMWIPGETIKIGPVNVFIPPDLAVGEYSIQMGLFSSKSTPTETVYVRESYTNTDIKDFIVGTIRVEAAAQEVSEKMEDLVISDFETPVDVKKWGLVDSLIEQSTDNVAEGKYAGKVTFLKGGALEIIRLSNFFKYCNPIYTNWSAYDEFRFYIYGPPDEAAHTYLKSSIILLLKDKTERRFEMPISTTTEKDKPVTVNLAKIGEIIDLTNIGDVGFYVGGTSNDQIVYLDGVKLVALGPPKKAEASVKFEELKLSKDKVRPGENIDIEASFSITRIFTKDHTLFVHICRSSDKAGWINADVLPSPPTSRWEVGKIIAQGPYSVYIPPDAPPGKYDIEMGLYLAQKTPEGADYVKYYRGKDGVYVVQQPSGPVDFFKEPYINYEQYGDWIVGSFEVVKE